MGAWAYYLEPVYYEIEVSAECMSCEKEHDTWGKIAEYSTTVYWKCPTCKTYNETETD